jgi:hypothetical protein
VKEKKAEREQRVAAFSRSVADFASSVRGLDVGSFLRPTPRWSARDVVAHLIGWNRYVIEGSRQLQKGELPFYDIDSGDNYSKVNAHLIREYPSEDASVLLDELQASADELAEFLRSLPYRRRPGVEISGSETTERSSPFGAPSTTSSLTTSTTVVSSSIGGGTLDEGARVVPGAEGIRVGSRT